jgi:hypothetical protein
MTSSLLVFVVVNSSISDSTSSSYYFSLADSYICSLNFSSSSGGTVFAI